MVVAYCSLLELSMIFQKWKVLNYFSETVIFVFSVFVEFQDVKGTWKCGGSKKSERVMDIEEKAFYINRKLLALHSPAMNEAYFGAEEQRMDESHWDIKWRS